MLSVNNTLTLLILTPQLKKVGGNWDTDSDWYSYPTWRNALTVRPEIIVHDLEQRETVPRVWWLLGQDLVHVLGEERPEDLGVLHHKIAKPGERLRYSVVGADRENIGRRTYTVGTFLAARSDGDVTLSTGPSRTQKTLLLP